MTRIASQVSQTRIGDYYLLEKIGEGSWGQVYKGRDSLSGKIVALKVMPESVVADEVLRMRFAQECQVARKLNHPHIVRVLDFGLEGSKAYLVMEYVVGESLGQRLQREGRLPEAEAVRVIEQIGEALHWAHQRRLIHRDVKPDNILLADTGHAKLTDLGLVKNLEDDLYLTQTQSGLGTPNFMAPEQFADAKRADALCDLYSLAATLYMAVTGKLPFRARNIHAVTAMYKKKLANEIIAPRTLVPELSERVESAILRALQADRKKRFASIPEFLDYLIAKPEPVPIAKSTPARTAVDEVPKQVVDADRRVKHRFPSQRATSCWALQQLPAKKWAGQLVNLSETGLCLELKRRFEPGTLLRSVLEGGQTSRRSLLARVVWVKLARPKIWHMGCQFDKPLCEFEVEELR
jgi:serine/threonine protein kinase